MMALFVDARGGEGGAGTSERPFSRLQQARDALRQRRREGPLGPVTVWLRGGTYAFLESFVLTAEDSGTPDAPVMYRAWPGEEVRLSGGLPLDPAAFGPMADPDLANRLAPGVRERLVQIDLVAAGIRDTGGLEPRGFAFPERPGDMELYDRDNRLSLARWPREGYAATGPVAQACSRVRDPAAGVMGLVDPGETPRGATFEGDPESIRRWSRPGDLLCFGLWAYDWAPSTIPVRALDPVRGLITLSAPSYGGVLEGRRYCVLNAVEEIARPGDWAVDRGAGLLYLFPPDRADACRLTVSALAEPLVVIRQAAHVVLQDLVFECSRGHGVAIEGNDVLVAGCTFRNLGGRGVNVDGSRNRVQACHIHGTGQGGIRVSGGDRRTLQPSGNVIENNEIHDFNRVCMTYNSAVWPAGCGHRIAHNLIYDAPHNAVLLHGNDHVFEYNEIHHVALEIDDASAFYMGRNPSEQGNVVRHNYFHHIGSPTAWGTSAIYPDDGSCGLTVSGNVFYRCGHAGQVCMGAFFNNGGKDHVIENNIFVDCRIAIGLMLMTQAHWELFIADADPDAKNIAGALYKTVDIRSEAYRQRYPWLADLSRNASSSTIRRNLAVRCGVLVTPEERQRVENNWTTDADPGFADLARLDFSLSPGSEAFRRIPGFEPVPFAKMGLRIDEYRTRLPERGGVECRPEMTVQPAVKRPGEQAPAILTLHLANLSAKPASREIAFWTTHPETVRAEQPRRTVVLGPREVRREELALTVTARPDLNPVVGARLSGSTFSLPVPVRPRYRLTCGSRGSVPGLAAVAEDLKLAPSFDFLQGHLKAGELRLQAAGDCLVVQAAFRDARPVPAGPVEGFWNGPFFGLLVAPLEAVSAAEVRQPLFFVHGPGDAGTLWFFDGHRQVDPDPAIRRVFKPVAGGWEWSAIVPFSALGLKSGSRAFRLEAMANLVPAPGQGPKLVTLFGSKTARLELATLAEVAIL